MPLTREQKINILEDLTDKFGRAKAAILVDFNKLSVSKTMELRRNLKSIDAEYKVAKKTLINRVLKSGKFENADLDSFKTQVGVVFSYADPAPMANSLFKFSKVNEALKILGGFLLARRSLGEGGGFEWRDKAKIIELAKLPSRKILLGQVVSVIAFPLSGLVTVLSGNMRSLVNVLNNIQNKRSS
ncbi:MAG: 50S ribosomal protein L10 [bacterium]|nr:50S ribosomal protein L10 [bacterium]